VESEDVGSEHAEPISPALEPAAHRETPVAMPKRDRVWSVLWSHTARQAAGFAGAGLLANLLAVLATALLTRNLVPTEYGNYAFGVSLLLFVSLFFEFGLFLPAARLAAVADGQQRREVVGAAVVVYLPVGVAFSVTIFVLSFWVDGWFRVDVGDALRIAAPAAVAIPFFIFVLQQLAQGVGRLHVASTATALAQLLLVALLAFCVGLVGGLSPASALVLRSLALLLASIVAVIWLRPIFHAIRRWVSTFVQAAREWGFQVYVGRVLSTGTYNMDVLMLGFWTDSRSVGLYVLASSLALASGLPVLGMASALFVRMAHEPAIASRWLLVATAAGAAFALGAVLLAEPAIRIVFSAQYSAAAGLMPALALAQVVRGVTAVYNTFLSAHGDGVALRNAGLVLAASNVAFNFALIPPYGAHGAAWASLLALVANLIAHVLFYRRSYRPASHA
jgi:O-antigen/teichoic acid export membrane protein